MAASTAPESVFDVDSFITEYYEAWSGTDLDLIMSYYGEGVVLQTPGVLMEGKEAVLAQFARPFTTAFPGNRHVVKNMIRGPGVVTVEFTFEAKHTGPFAGHAATGNRIKLPGCGVYEYDSAKRQITSGRIYFDVGTLLQTITELPVIDPQKITGALHLNEHNLSVIINTIPTTAWTTRPDGYCDFLNQRWLDYAGMTAEQAKGWGWAAAIHPDDREGLVEYWTSCLASGVPVEAEGRMRRYDGSYRWFLFRTNPVRDESGKILKWYGTNIDIEDRKRGEEALRASELSWRQIVDNIPGFVATTTGMGEVEFLNRQTLEYFGKTTEELKNWALIDAVHPDDLPHVIKTRKESIETGQIYEVEHRCRRADGVYRWFQVRGLPVRNAEGTITAWYLLLTDIEDLKKAEEALQASERNLILTINTIPTFISVSRADGTVLSVNQAALDYHGVTLQDVQRGVHRTRFFHPDDVERVREVRKEGLKHPRPFEYEQRALGKDGKYRWFSVRHNPLLDDQGRIERWYAIAFDIEDRKRVEWLRAAETRTLQMITEGASLPDILNHVCASIDLQITPWFTTILLMDPDGKRLWPSAGSKVPQDWTSAITPLPVAADTGLCGTAAFLKTRVIVPDVASESTWREEYRAPALKNGIRAGWSQPIFTKDNQVLGTFAIYSAEPRVPTNEDLALIEAGARITLIAIERQQSQEALRNALDEIQKSESKLRQVIDAIPALAWCNLPDGPNEFLNKGWHEYTGFTPEQSHGWGWQAAFHPEDLPPLMEKWMKMLTSGEPDEVEARLRRHDGVYRWFLIRAQPFRDESGKIVRWYGTSTDIDDRKRAEEALRSSERNLRQITDAIPSNIHVLRTDGSVLYVNQAVLDYHGTTLEDVQKPDYRARFFHPEDIERLRKERRDALLRPVPFENEQRAIGKDGKYHWFLIRYNPLLDEQGKVDRWYVAAFDIEDRKRAEEELRARELELRSSLDNMPGFLGRHSPDGTPEIVNRPFLQYHGKTLEEIGQWRTSDVVHRDDLAHVIEGLASGISGGQPWGLEFRLRRFDGIYRWFQARWVPVRDGEGRVLHWNALTTDIDDRKRAEDALARHAGVRGDVSAAFSRPTHLREILRGCTEAIVRHLDAAFARIWLLNKDESVLELQASAGMYTRLDGSYSRIPVGDLKVGLIAREKKAHFTNDVMNDPRVNDKRWARRSGMVAFAGYPLVVEERLIGVVALFARRPLAGSILDTLASVADTIAQGVERKRAEEALTSARSELAHMARVTTLSALTASIAHEINQPIFAAITSAGACLRWLNRDQPEVQRAREAAMRIEEDGKRAAEIITHLKSFYKKDLSPQRELVSMNDLVGEMLVLLRSEADRHSVVMRTQLAADLHSVSADRVQLQQVLMNLMLNGMEAMSERGGELKISTRCEGGEVMVSVSDTGVGIPAEKMEEIFNEFFTTKAGGTGMGLAISSTIIESHGGRLRATANLGSGATFHFTLPIESEAPK